MKRTGGSAERDMQQPDDSESKLWGGRICANVFV